MNRAQILLVVTAILLFACALPAAKETPAAAEETLASAKETLAEAMSQYCFHCHNEQTSEGDINLAAAVHAKPHGLVSDLELADRLLDALENGEMPPEDEEQPTRAERDRWIAQLKSLVENRLAKQSALAPVPLRRMNRLEYNNAVKHLFDLKRDAFALPERTVRDIGGYFQPASGKMPEEVVVGNRAMGKSQFLGTGNTLRGVAAFPKDARAEHGFDNRADHLTISPLLMESFFALSQSIVNSEDFPRYSGVWESLFGAPPEASDEQLRYIGRTRLAQFLRRAFRRDVADDTVDRYNARFLQKLAAGKSFSESMKGAISAALVSPRFLYVDSGTGSHSGTAKESAAAETEQPQHDFALASRLSFFLWSGPPDDTLLDLASRGKLRDVRVLEQQVDRMLNDARIKNFCDAFALQWLQLDQTVAALPDYGIYRSYYFGGMGDNVYLVGMHAMIEPLLLFETVLVENRPVTDLVDPDFTYLSDKLKKWYTGETGRDEVTDIRFKRVPVTDRRHGGVITNAAVMTMTSLPLRTKPITRGAWLATTIFNDPPQPPPAAVPELEAGEEQLKKEGLTLRDKLREHVSRKDCAACHQKIDPLGFALENYDPVGRWRDTYRTGLAVDASGKLFGKHEFANATELKDAIRAEKSRFTRALAKHLLSYALSRTLDAADRSSLDTIVAETENDNDRFRTLIKQVVLSPSFRNSP